MASRSWNSDSANEVTAATAKPPARLTSVERSRVKVRSEPIGGGMRFIVTGTGMTAAHAATTDGFGGWHFTAKAIDDGATLDVHVPAKDLSELKGIVSLAY